MIAYLPAHYPGEPLIFIIAGVGYSETVNVADCCPLGNGALDLWHLSKTLLLLALPELPAQGKMVLVELQYARRH